MGTLTPHSTVVGKPAHAMPSPWRAPLKENMKTPFCHSHSGRGGRLLQGGGWQRFFGLAGVHLPPLSERWHGQIFRRLAGCLSDVATYWNPYIFPGAGREIEARFRRQTQCRPER